MSEKLKWPHPLFLIVIIGILLYGQSLSFDYTNFDDNTLILDNQKFISDISNFSEAFKKSVFLNGSDLFYRPMQTVWFILNAQVGGADLFIYHLSSVLLHFLAAYLIFILLRKFNYAKEPALFLSLFFLVHPLFVQAIAWVPGVGDLLLTVFTLASFLFFLEFIQSNDRKYYVLHLFFFALALFSKETAVAIVPVCLFYLHFVRKENLISYNKKVFLIGWLTVGLVWFLMRDSALQNQQQKSIAEIISSLLLNMPTMLQYIGKIVFPFNLSVMPVMQDTTYITGVLALLFFAFLIYKSPNKRVGWLLFSFAWFFFFLLPTFIGTTEYRIHQSYEHRMYLPMIGFLFFMGEIDILKKFSIENIYHRLAAGGILLMLFIVTFRHEKVFSSMKLFLENAVSTSPHSSLAHRNMGIYYQDLADQYRKKQMLKEAEDALVHAEAEYRQALELNPYEKDLHNNRGVIYDSWGKKDLAEKEYQIEARLNPANPQSFHNLGVLYAQKDENEKAEIYFKKAIDILPSIGSYQQLALLYKKMGKITDYQKIVMMLQQTQQQVSIPSKQEQSPSSQLADNISIARQLVQEGRMAEAEEVLKKELTLHPSNTKALFNIGLIYYSKRQLSEAEQFWRKAVQLDSTYTDAMNNLAICLAQQNKSSEAESVLKKIILSNPNYPDGYFNLANFYAKKGEEKKALYYIQQLKKRGIGIAQFRDRGINVSLELQKLFEY